MREKLSASIRKYVYGKAGVKNGIGFFFLVIARKKNER
jgi:hypothetical protein